MGFFLLRDAGALVSSIGSFFWFMSFCKPLFLVFVVYSTMSDETFFDLTNNKYLADTLVHVYSFLTHRYISSQQ